MLLWIGNNQNIINSYFDDNIHHHDKAYFDKNVHHESSFIPKSMKLENTQLKIELDQFYDPCNKKLYRFLQHHSDLLLFKANFNFAT